MDLTSEKLAGRWPVGKLKQDFKGERRSWTCREVIVASKVEFCTIATYMSTAGFCN